MYSPFSPMIASSSGLDGSGGDAQVYTVGMRLSIYLERYLPWIGRGEHSLRNGT